MFEKISEIAAGRNIHAKNFKKVKSEMRGAIHQLEQSTIFTPHIPVSYCEDALKKINKVMATISNHLLTPDENNRIHKIKSFLSYRVALMQGRCTTGSEIEIWPTDAFVKALTTPTGTIEPLYVRGKSKYSPWLDFIKRRTGVDDVRDVPFATLRLLELVARYCGLPIPADFSIPEQKVAHVQPS